jgi:Mce-associated membrane protein
MADDAATPEGELKTPTTDEAEDAATPSAETADGTTDAELTKSVAADGDEVTGTEVADYDAEVTDEASATSVEAAPKTGVSHLRLATIAGVVLVLALGGLVGYLGVRAFDVRKTDELRKEFVQVGRQGALNLTTIDYQQADTDIQRILASATGTFYDDFSKRSQPFIDVVKQAQSKSVGSITEAGLESQSGDDAQVLVAVTVKTSNLGAAEQEPRAWRMRISVKKLGDDMKVANVEFVP